MDEKTVEQKGKEIVNAVEELNKLLEIYASEDVVYQVQPRKVRLTEKVSCIQFECDVYERKASHKIVDTKEKPPID